MHDSLISDHYASKNCAAIYSKFRNIILLETFPLWRDKITALRRIAEAEFDLTGAAGQLNVTARDTGNGDGVIELGQLHPGEHSWQAPYISDWVISAGY